MWFDKAISRQLTTQAKQWYLSGPENRLVIYSSASVPRKLNGNGAKE